MASFDVKMVILSTDDLDKVDPLLQRDAGHAAQVPRRFALRRARRRVGHPGSGHLDRPPDAEAKVVPGIKTDDVDAAAAAIGANGGAIVKGPYDDEHERRRRRLRPQGQQPGLLQPYRADGNHPARPPAPAF